MLKRLPNFVSWHERKKSACSCAELAQAPAPKARAVMRCTLTEQYTSRLFSREKPWSTSWLKGAGTSTGALRGLPPRCESRRPRWAGAGCRPAASPPAQLRQGQQRPARSPQQQQQPWRGGAAWRASGYSSARLLETLQQAQKDYAWQEAIAPQYPGICVHII